MDAKQFWTTVLISAVVAVIVFFLLTLVTPNILGRALGSFTSTGPSLPDLIVKDVSLIKSGCSENGKNCWANFSVTVFNAGLANSGASTTDFTIRGPETHSVYLYVPPLERGKSFVLGADFMTTKGSYDGIVTVDKYFEVEESNEDNNVFTSLFTID